MSEICSTLEIFEITENFTTSSKTLFMWWYNQVFFIFKNANFIMQILACSLLSIQS